jgi:c-di-GMP-binding flagellar brake protein YcgR
MKSEKKCNLCGKIIEEYPACFEISNLDGTNHRYLHDNCFKIEQEKMRKRE